MRKFVQCVTAYGFLALCLIFPSLASASIMSFDDQTLGWMPQGTVISEDGYDLSVNSNTSFYVMPAGAGNLSFQTGRPGFWAAEGSNIAITRTDGGLFSLKSFDIASGEAGTLSSTLEMAAFSGGALLGAGQSFASTDAQSIGNPGLAGAMDMLVITVTDPGNTFVMLDNIVFEEVASVPLPATAFLLLSGCLTLPLLRRRVRA